MPINSNLRSARITLDMSQNKLAEAVGVSKQTIVAIERGDYSPSIKLSKTICKVLGKSLDELFGEENGNEV
ncbi:helix-turn-helix transcriptional regulator [Lachnospiraceae bacterium MD1]|jgi:putative transcriptional regulator|uniref:Helix-turn-helix transcriptional regulator n=1 Tax=Variimorphobacter saccharofermentans TaxID=2755051 RepID=A0A839K3V7_9FIRM|nr:helix-turn-helix transcriptional regulator [Variimorphobacter saccharofermentans]MBB2184585.1 helix-turn-helix transcriptional regulator [Variimorphobacter saccharofermentans]